MAAPVVLITPEPFFHVRGTWVEHLEAAGLAVRYPEDTRFCQGNCSPQETIRGMQGVAAVISGGDRFTAEVIAGLPDLRVIARAGVGYDRVDVPAATAHGIPVTITPTANHEAVAEAAIALVFALAKQIVPNDARTRSGAWAKGPTRPVRGQTLGILGLGRIGRSCALRARALGMHVLATEAYPDTAFVEQHAIELVPLEALLARSDYLTLHCPLNDTTRGMCNRSLFQRMKPGSALINTARGGLVVEADLLEALRSGHLSGAGLDVFEQEPATRDNPLFRLENLVLSPHVAGIDEYSLRDMAIESADCIIRLARGEWPTGAVVNDELRSTWQWRS